MSLRPEHGWWRTVWRTALAVGATALLAISASRAHDRTSHPSGTPQARAQAGGLTPSNPPQPGTSPSADSEPSAAAPPDGQPSADPGGGDDAPDQENPINTDMSGGVDPDPDPGSDSPGAPATGEPESPGQATGTPAAADVCGDDTDCVQTEEDVDVCDSDGGSCDLTAEDADQPDE
jgi:hypothetical protein